MKQRSCHARTMGAHLPYLPAEPGAPGPPGAPREEAALECKVGLPALGPFSAQASEHTRGFPEMLGAGALASILEQHTYK